MRKAVQAARLGGKSRNSNSRKNDDRESAREGNNGHGGNGNGHGNNGGLLHEHSGMPMMPVVKLRKTTPEEAALTAKNYRLAKELSELRVRHREECKNVTRLTMENMNLASRCREAISHVAMLKKDLATSQRRTAEVIHNYQRQHVDSMRAQQQQQQQQQQQGVGGAAASASTAATASVSTTRQQPQQPPHEIIFIPGTADMDATAAAAAAAPRSAEKVAPQPSPRALNVARDLEQMDELLNATTTTPTSIKQPSPTNNGGVSSNSNSRLEPEAPTAAAPALAVQTLEQQQPLTVAAAAAAAAVSPAQQQQTKATPPPLAEALAATAVAVASITAPTVSTTTSADNEEAGTIAASCSYPLSEPVDSDDFEDVYNQADASIPLSTRPLSTAVAAAAVTSTPTTTPPMSPSSSTKPPLVGKNDLDDDDDEDDNDGEDPSDVVGDTTRRTVPSKLVSAFFPHSASPKLGRGGVGAGGYNEEFPGDITAVARKPSATRSRLARLSGFAEMDDETSAMIPTINHHHLGSNSLLSSSSEQPSKMGVFDNRAMVAARGGGAQDKSTLSSIDAFEASFRTDFPETFSPRESTVAEEKKSSTGEPYNPFFPSPQKGRPEIDDSSASALPVPVVGGVGSGGGGTIRSGFVASLVAASKENAAAAAAAQQEQQRDSSLSPTSLQHHHRFFESKRSKDPPGRDRTSPRSLMKNTGIVTNNSPKQKTTASLSAKDSLASPRNASLSSPRTSALLQRRSAPAVTPISQLQQQKSPGFATAAALPPPPLDMEKFRSPNLFNLSRASSTPTIVTNTSTPTTPLSPTRSSPTNEDNGSGSGSAVAAAAAGAVAVEPKRPEKTGYDLARLRYEKALANRKTRTPNFDSVDNNSATSSQETAKSSSQPRRSSIDSSSNSSSNNDVVAKPPTTPKENKNNAANSSSSAEAAGAATMDSTPPISTILTTPKSSRTAPSEQQQQAVVSTPPKSQTNSTATATTPPSKMAVVDGQPVVSVRDRLSLFSDRTPRSPEKEAARLQAIANSRRLDLDTSYEDEGDIPLPTSINRRSAAEEATAASAEFSNNSTATTNSASIISPRNKPFPPKSPGNSSVNSGGGTPIGYINVGANQNAANTYTSLTRHRPWDSNNNNNMNTANDEMDFDPTADPKISVSNHPSTTAADVTFNSGGLNKPRRSVSHPVSYAEPSLRTKLRNGDMYFPKDEGAFYTASTTTTSTPAAAATTTNNAE